MKQFLIFALIATSFTFAQLDTSTLADNHWVQIMDESMTINGNNWVYENDFKGDPNSRLFILGPGHVVHPQDCYYYPYDMLDGRWYKTHSPARPTRQCLSSFAINSQDSVILQMAGGEMGHQLSQGGFNDSYTSIMPDRRRGSVLWSYSLSRNKWAYMGSPTTFNTTDYTILAQYDPVHDVMISIYRGNVSLYSYHSNKSVTLPAPVSVSQYAFSTTVDTRRGLFYVLASSGLYAFNPDSGNGRRIADAGPGYHDASAGANGLSLNLIDYDEANDVILYVFDGTSGNTSLSTNSQTWIFKCDSLVWQQLTPVASPPDRGRVAYNRHLNMFMMAGGLSSGVISRGGNTKTSWAYRYKRTPRLMDLLAPAPKAEATTLSATENKIDWQTVTGASGYNVYRASCPNGYPVNFTKLNSSPVTSTTYTDNSGTAGIMYSYRVAAIRDGEEGLLSRHCYNKPGIITDLAASVEDSTVVKVSWVPRPENDIVGYNIYRAKGLGIYQSAMHGYYTKVNSTPVNATEYWDTINATGNTLKDMVARGYVVCAVNAAGLEAGPSVVATTFPDSPEWAYTIPISGKFRFGWQPPRRTKITGINLYRVHGSKLNTALITDTVTNDWPWPPTTGADGYSLQGQTYYARAVNILGQEGFMTDQISPSLSTFGYGIVTPISARFNYTPFLDLTSTEKMPLALAATKYNPVIVHPNPFNPVVNLSVFVGNSKKVEVILINSLGKIVERKHLETINGTLNLMYNMTDKPSGVYIFKIVSGRNTFTQKATLLK